CAGALLLRRLVDRAAAVRVAEGGAGAVLHVALAVLGAVVGAGDREGLARIDAHALLGDAEAERLALLGALTVVVGGHDAALVFGGALAFGGACRGALAVVVGGGDAGPLLTGRAEAVLGAGHRLLACRVGIAAAEQQRAESQKEPADPCVHRSSGTPSYRETPGGWG